MSIDKRQHERRDIELKVLYKSITNFLNDYTANISIGGCFLNTQQQFEMGQDIELILVLPNGQDIHATGVVRWVSSDAKFPGVGVQFTVLSERDRELIETLVSEQN